MRLGYRLERAWAWFSGELSSLVPGWMHLAYLGGPQPVPGRFDKDVTRIAPSRSGYLIPLAWIEQETAGRSRRAIVIDLTLPPHLLLEREVQIPLGAEATASNIAKLDLLRRTPFTETDVRVAESRPKNGSSGKFVKQWIAKNSQIDDLVELMDHRNIRVRRVLAHKDAVRPLLNRGNAIYRFRRPFQLANLGLLGVCAALGMAIWLAPAMQAQAKLSALQTEKLLLQREAVAARDKLQDANQAFEQQEIAVRALYGRPSFGLVLSTVTRALPDQVWLSELSYNQDGVTLRGSSKTSATDVVLALSEFGAVFQSPSLSGAVARDADGAERFQVTATLAGGDE